MRLYRFTKDADIDVTIVTDGINDQKRVFITESPRGIVTPGQILAKDEQDLGAALVAMGFNWKAGESVMHEELVAFAKTNGLTLQIEKEGLETEIIVP